MTVIELTITHNGKHWIAGNDELSVQAATLVELDVELKRLLQERGYLKKGETVEVFMACDRSIIPRWMHQYGHHYFNRIVELKG